MKLSEQECQRGVGIVDKKKSAEEILAEIRGAKKRDPDIDKEYKGKLKEKGMIVTEYDKPFFDQVLALDSIKELYKEIDQQVNGLGTTLQEELENYAKK